jgi:hypothetical protein
MVKEDKVKLSPRYTLDRRLGGPQSKLGGGVHFRVSSAPNIITDKFI